MSIEDEIKAIEKIRKDADDLNHKLCVREREWVLSIPARRGHDPDLVFGELSSANQRLVAALVEARRRLRMARGESFDTLPKNESDTKWPDEWNAKDDTAILSILRGEQ